MASWQQAWDNAQPKLATIRDTLNSNDSPRARIIRVGQLDAELLDQELIHVLQEPLNKALSLVNSSLRARFDPELSLLIQLTLYKLSIWNLGASYGAKLQDLRYVVPSHSDLSLSPSGLPRRILLIHGTLTVILPYLHTRLRSHALSRAWPDAPSSDRRRKAWEILTSLEASYTLAGLLSFVAFLWDGRYRTIADRLLRMSLVPSRRLVKRDVSYEFMNRQMVWHSFTEFLLFLLPLISARSIRRRINRISRMTISSVASIFSFSQTHSSDSKRPSNLPVKKRGKYWSLPEDQCAICAENASFNLNPSDSVNAFTSFTLPTPAEASSSSVVPPQHTSEDFDTDPPAYPIYTPYVTSCGDVYCYHCIAERMMRAADDGEDEAGWECLRCGEGVRGAERFVVEVQSELSGSEYEFSSDLDMDITDMSGSAGSYSESGLSDDY